MKKENNITAITGFLIPPIFLYGMFFALKFIEDGFLSLIYSAVILLFAFTLYLEVNDIDAKINMMVKYAVMIACLIYLLLVLGSVTHYLSL